MCSGKRYSARIVMINGQSRLYSDAKCLMSCDAKTTIEHLCGNCYNTGLPKQTNHERERTKYDRKDAQIPKKHGCATM